MSQSNIKSPINGYQNSVEVTGVNINVSDALSVILLHLLSINYCLILLKKLKSGFQIINVSLDLSNCFSTGL